MLWGALPGQSSRLPCAPGLCRAAHWPWLLAERWSWGSGTVLTGAAGEAVMRLTQLKRAQQFPCRDVWMLWSGSPGNSWPEVCDRTGVVVLVQSWWSLLFEPSSTAMGADVPRDFTEAPDTKPVSTAFSLLQSQLGDTARKKSSACT